MQEQEQTDFPKVFLYHTDGGHMQRSDIVPSHSHEGKPSPFTILPLEDVNNDEKDTDRKLRVSTITSID